MILNREPVVIAGLIQAALALAVSFGLKLSPEQIGAIMAFTAAALALLLRSRVTPVSK
jgi:hypothetical protein